MKVKYIYSLIIALFITFSCQRDDLTRLSFPENISASDEYALKNMINWDVVENAQGYNIYRSEYDYYSFSNPADTDYIKIATVTTNLFEDRNVNPGTTYYYKIEAFNGSFHGQKSDVIIGYTTNLTADEVFDELAKSTSGMKYKANSAYEVPDRIINILHEHAVVGTDIILLIDNTASMWDDIGQIRSSSQKILATLPPNSKVAIATYADANYDQPWHTWTDFTTDQNTVQDFINNIQLVEGGDTPESVYDGICVTIEKLPQTNSNKKVMIIIGDSPPHENSLSNYTLSDVVNKCNSISFSLNLYPILVSRY